VARCCEHGNEPSGSLNGNFIECLNNFGSPRRTRHHGVVYVHEYAYIYIYVCVCVCVRFKIKNIKHYQTYYSPTDDHDLKIRYQPFVFNYLFIFSDKISLP
jgi:hypothetical protein